MNDVPMATHQDVLVLFYSIVTTGIYLLISVSMILYQLGKAARRQDQILRKLNNQQPDNEGGY
jgi:hypothetical protein